MPRLEIMQFVHLESRYLGQFVLPEHMGGG